MNILMIMDPGIPVPPILYGGHERLVFLFAEEYNKRGHRVSLLAGPGSSISGSTWVFGKNDLSRSRWQRARELVQAWWFLYRRRNEFDAIHNFGRLIYLLPVLNQRVKKIMTYGRPVSRRGIRWANRLPNRQMVFTACSRYCTSTGNIAGRWETVYNAIDFSSYQVREHVSDTAPLMFLGRLDKVKGLRQAIEAAIKSGHQLLIGGNIPDTADNYLYFKEQLEPLFDGEQVIYLGALNDEQKNTYLGSAKALLFPIQWDEPFGMVMIEAMACGTPVIAFNRGAVPEIVINGVNGFIVESTEEMVTAIARIGTINRRQCRESVETQVDVGVIATHYLNLMEQC